MSEYQQAAYNIHEHNHIDKDAWTAERLDARGRELKWSMENISHHPDRLAAIKNEIGIIAFEMWYRYQDDEFDFKK